MREHSVQLPVAVLEKAEQWHLRSVRQRCTAFRPHVARTHAEASPFEHRAQRLADRRGRGKPRRVTTCRVAVRLLCIEPDAATWETPLEQHLAQPRVVGVRQRKSWDQNATHVLQLFGCSCPHIVGASVLDVWAFGERQPRVISAKDCAGLPVLETPGSRRLAFGPETGTRVPLPSRCS